MPSMFGYNGHAAGYSDHQTSSGSLPSIPSLFPSLPPGIAHLHSHSGSPTTEDMFYNPASFASYQNSLKRPKKKMRSPKIGPDGVPCKRKSREGTTTYLWEFLLKLLQVCDQQHNMIVIIMVIMPSEIPYSIYIVGYKEEFFQKYLHLLSIFVYLPFTKTLNSSG